MDTQSVIEKLKEQCTIVVFGDSISRGVIYDEEKHRHSLLLESFTNLVKEHLRGVVFNAAKFGSTIVEGFQRLQTDVLQRKPDIVLIEFGGNDCDFHWDAIAENPSGQYLPKTERKTFYELLSELVAQLNTMNIIPVLVSLPPLDAEKYFRWVSKNSEQAQENILKYIGNISRIYSWHEQYNAAILRVAEETKTRLIDIRSSFLQSDDYTKLICLDGIHPNKEGHRIIADKILQYIQTNYTFLLNNQPQISA
ncbi:MAG: SGNH/GDSL hydrolase family protein [Bacteriovoracaceae bacterium]|nr:SGNH/GDSL hydrolase family protein [Bacteroidota bacterium]